MMFMLISINDAGKQVGHDGGRDDTDEAWHHERVVQQVLAYHRSARPVKVDRGDVAGIVGDEEVAID